MKKREEVVPSWGRMIKILRIMKLTAVLIVILSIQAFAIRGQNAKYSLSMDKATFVEVIEQLEKMSGYHFMLKYNQEILDKKVDLNYSEATLQEILTDLLRGTGFSYKFIDKYIAITPVGETASEEQQPGRSVTGKVTGAKGEPLPGVTVVVKGTSSGTITNADGSYTISNIPDNAILVFSFVGMKSREVLVGNQTNINMILEEETIGIGEVVAIGYGTVRKSDLTGSLSSIESEKISAFPATTVSQALQGRASGVHVIQNTGRPGAGLQIRIRGTNSIKGDNSPLWIIDGFPGDESMLNLSDIEGIEVLKDASATAIYGSRGANGVILITTKHGKAGATRVDYDGSFTLNTVRKRINLCDAQEYMLLQNIQQLNDVGKE